MTVRNNEKDSDVSSDSSWTLIDELETISRPNSCSDVDGAGVAKENITKALLEKPLEVEEKNENPQLISTNTKTARNRNKKKRHSNNKQGTDHIHYLSIAACLLTITGITMLTTLLPLNYAESAHIENLQQHLKNVYEHSKNPSIENSISSIQATINAIEATRATDTLNIVSDNIGDQPTCDALFPEYSNTSLTSDDISRLRIKIIAPYNEDIFENVNEINEPCGIIELIQNTTESLVQGAKDLIKSSTMQLIVATLVQDLCLIKLINEFSKRTREESLEIKAGQQTGVKTNKIIKKCSGLSQKKNIKQEIAERRKNRSKIFKKISVPPAIESHTEANQIPANENGKSECERRFEDLDSRWSILGQHHRQKIQEIKNKFQEEIFRINDIEKEGLSRKQKIRFTREKYIQKLKANREVYLHRLRKIREERQVVLKDVCQNSRNSKNLNSKDVSVGNFALLLSSDYDFPKKLENLKVKAKSDGSGKLETANNKTFNYTSNNNSSAGPEKIITEDAQRKNSLNKKPKLAEKKQADTDVKAVQDVVTNILDSLPKDESKSLDNNISQELILLPATPFENVTDGEPFQLVRKRKTSKKNLNDLYDVAFDHQSKKIKEQDSMKWNRKFDTFNWSIAPDLMTKQDPQRNRRKKILHKGLL